MHDIVCSWTNLSVFFFSWTLTLIWTATTSALLKKESLWLKMAVHSRARMKGMMAHNLSFPEPLKAAGGVSVIFSFEQLCWYHATPSSLPTNESMWYIGVIAKATYSWALIGYWVPRRGVAMELVRNRAHSFAQLLVKKKKKVPKAPCQDHQLWSTLNPPDEMMSNSQITKTIPIWEK